MPGETTVSCGVDDVKALRTLDEPSITDPWVEIDGTRLRDNIRAVQQRVGSSRIIGVAKANAYGHGAKEVAQAYMDCGVDMLAVATLAEAKETLLKNIEAALISEKKLSVQ